VQRSLVISLQANHLALMAQLEGNRWMRLSDMVFSDSTNLYHQLEELLKSNHDSAFSDIWFTDDAFHSSWILDSDLISESSLPNLRFRTVPLEKDGRSLQLAYQASAYESLLTSFGLPLYYMSISELLSRRSLDMHKNSRDQKTCSICLIEKSCFFHVVNESQFEGESFYKVDKQDDVLYYLMLLLSQKGWQNEDVSIYLSGRGSLFSTVENLLNSYQKIKSMDVGSDALHYPELKYLSLCAS